MTQIITYLSNHGLRPLEIFILAGVILGCVPLTRTIFNIIVAQNGLLAEIKHLVEGHKEIKGEVKELRGKYDDVCKQGADYAREQLEEIKSLKNIISESLKKGVS
jgi:hypothetical protein